MRVDFAAVSIFTVPVISKGGTIKLLQQGRVPAMDQDAPIQELHKKQNKRGLVSSLLPEARKSEKT